MGTSLPPEAMTRVRPTTAEIPTVDHVMHLGIPIAPETPMEDPQVVAETHTEGHPAGDVIRSEDHPGIPMGRTRGGITMVAGIRMHPGAMMMAHHPEDMPMRLLHPDTKAAVAATTATEGHPETETMMVHVQGAHLGQWAQETIVPVDPQGGHLGMNAAP